MRFDADAHLYSLGPGMVTEGPLGFDGGVEGPLGRGEGVEEGVSLGVDLDPFVGGKGLSQQGAVVLEDVAVAGAEGVQQARGALDVGEEEGDGACGQVSHTSSGSSGGFRA